MRFSFLGLGNMGEPLAMNLLKAGEQLTVYTRRPDCAQRFRDDGAQVADTVTELADCDVVCTCLPLPEHLLAAMTGANGLYARMRPGTIHLEFSTIGPATAEDLAAQAARAGIEYVQATVSKTPAVAARGEAPLFLGGSSQAIATLMPVLRRIAQPHELGTVRAACAVKLISNLIGMSNVALVAEGLRIGQLAGLDGEKLLSLLLETGCASFQMQARGPWMLAEDFRARFSIDLAAKDLSLGCEMSGQWGYDPKLMRQTLAYLRQGRSLGIGEEDVCALIKLMH